jgi:hypothetical protein
LILVEQHDAVPGPDALGEPLLLGDQPVGQSDEIGEVDHPGGRLEALVCVEDLDEGIALQGDGVITRLDEVSGTAEVITQGRGEPRHPVDHVAGPGEVEERPRCCGDRVSNQLTGVPRGDDANPGGHAHQGPELHEQRVGEPVVCGDLDLAALGGRLRDGAANPIGHLPCRLVGESDP